MAIQETLVHVLFLAQHLNNCDPQCWSGVIAGSLLMSSDESLKYPKIAIKQVHCIFISFFFSLNFVK